MIAARGPSYDGPLAAIIFYFPFSSRLISTAMLLGSVSGRKDLPIRWPFGEVNVPLLFQNAFQQWELCLRYSLIEVSIPSSMDQRLEILFLIDTIE